MGFFSTAMIYKTISYLAKKEFKENILVQEKLLHNSVNIMFKSKMYLEEYIKKKNELVT